MFQIHQKELLLCFCLLLNTHFLLQQTVVLQVGISLLGVESNVQAIQVQSGFSLSLLICCRRWFPFHHQSGRNIQSWYLRTQSRENSQHNFLRAELCNVSNCQPDFLQKTYLYVLIIEHNFMAALADIILSRDLYNLYIYQIQILINPENSCQQVTENEWHDKFT